MMIRNILMLLIFLITGLAHASLDKSLWPKWNATNPLSQQVISHKKWQRFLEKQIITNEEHINLIDYAHLKASDLSLLKEYLQDMSQIDIDKYNRQEQLAYWLNVYNALIIQVVADYYPVANIQEISISPGLFSMGPWGANLITINGSPLSLDDINNRIIRPVWNDARTQYALNNATMGAPNLSKQAYEGKSLEKQLNHAAWDYVNSLRGAQVIEGKLILSKLYENYQEDFGGTKKNIVKHLLQFAKEPLLSQLKHINSIDSYTYNWHINCPPAIQP